MVVRRLLLDILVFLHHPPLQGVPGWCYAFSLLWPEQFQLWCGVRCWEGIEASPGKTSGMSWAAIPVYSPTPLISAG